MLKLFLPTVDSTNRYLLEHAAFLPHFCVLRAGCQSAGRGRFARNWVSPVGGLWFSLLLKHFPLPRNVIPSLLALAGLDVLEKLCGKGFWLKWPNDIVFSTGMPSTEGKVAGILGQFCGQGEKGVLVVGMGMNINNAVPGKLDFPAVSLRDVCHQHREVVPVYFALLDAFQENWNRFEPGAWKRRVRQKSYFHAGERVSLHCALSEKRWEGTLVDTPVEALELVLDSGESKSFQAGDVRKVRVERGSSR